MEIFIKLLIIILITIKSLTNGLVDIDKDNITSPSSNSMNCSNISNDIIKEIQNYKSIANEIINIIMNGNFSGTTYNDLEYFVDHFGSRLVGSDALELSIDYILDKMKNLGFDNVHAENVTAPKWVRGDEYVTMLNPWRKPISVLGLALSTSTPQEGITAEVIVVDSFIDLKKNVKNATGKIIVYNQPFENPEKAILYRQKGAIEGAKLGAVATLVRSYTTFSLGTPHTGLMFYENNITNIPAGEISIEDAQLLYRLYKKGEKIILHIKLENIHKGNITTRNSIGDLKGTTKPNEFVLISGHIDSWDVGQGVLDDGYGVILSIKTIEILKALNLTTKRTLRSILWTAEEIGQIPMGAEQYLKLHKNELLNYTIFLEADSGIFNPHGLIFNGTEDAGCIVSEILKLLEPELIKTTKLYPNFPRLKTDIVPLMQGTGVPGALIATDSNKYFWYHHSNADTMTAVNSNDLDKCLAMWTVLSYVLGDLSIMLPRDDQI